MSSPIRQNFHEDSEGMINRLINMELQAYYVYLSMSSYFDRDSVALPGIKHFCEEMSCKKRGDADRLIEYQNKRGGKTVFEPIKSPSGSSDTVLMGLKDVLVIEKRINQFLLDLHRKACDKYDPHLADFLENKYLDEEVQVMSKICHYITRVNRAGPSGLGEYIFDRDISS